MAQARASPRWSRIARARPRTPRSRISRWRRVRARSRPARCAAPIASASTTSCCASRPSSAIARATRGGTRLAGAAGCESPGPHRLRAAAAALRRRGRRSPPWHSRRRAHRECAIAKTNKAGGPLRRCGSSSPEDRRGGARGDHGRAGQPSPGPRAARAARRGQWWSDICCRARADGEPQRRAARTHPRIFLAPFFILQADTPDLLRMALESFEVRADIVGLAMCGERDCFVIGDPRREVPPPPPRSCAGSSRRGRGAGRARGDDYESGLEGPTLDDAGTDEPADADRNWPKLWVDMESFEIRGHRLGRRRPRASSGRSRPSTICVFRPGSLFIEEPGKGTSPFRRAARRSGHRTCLGLHPRMAHEPRRLS